MDKKFKEEFDKVKHLLKPNFDLDTAFKDKKFKDSINYLIEKLGGI